MDDKFIMMNLDDARSKKIAEVMKSEACKKILDYLSGTKEASEKDIADALKMPINTAEYNLKKLIESGLVEKTTNFFWSTKGKKIPLYKIAKKHILISPRDSKLNLKALNTILPIIFAVAVIAIVLVILMTPPKYQEIPATFKTFKSELELKNFIEENKISNEKWNFGGMLESATDGVATQKTTTTGAESGGASEYSETNIQVEGVDEADIIKNDGKYIYTVSGNSVSIIDAYPAENMKILSEINFSESINEIFVNDDKLIVFLNDYEVIEYGTREGEVGIMKKAVASDVAICMPGRCGGYGKSFSVVKVYDISDRENPVIEHEFKTEGNYVDSRMIGNYVYVISNQYIYDDRIMLPEITKDNITEEVPATEIAYAPITDNSFQYTIILGIDIDSGEMNKDVSITGTSQNLYVSEKNIYTTIFNYRWYKSNLEENKINESNLETSEKTIVHKVSIDGLDIKHVASGEVPGNVLNQFSMDENDGKFRIATTAYVYVNVDTTQESYEEVAIKTEKGFIGTGKTIEEQNNLYVLDENLNIVGKLEGLAPKEKIYSVRFIGDRAYIVTFKRIDPLFVIDLSDDSNPKILGKLKIPGYSDYLHPYDENHIIGIGKEAAESQYNDFAWYQGIKMAVFDVTDPENPIEMYKVVIGDRGTDSEALRDHKAFLFDREKELLVIPVTLAEYKTPPTESWQYGEQTFQGAYVYNLNLENGFELKGRITHVTQEEEMKSGYYYGWNSQIRRSLYMDDTLYTMSNERIKANDLTDDNLSEINVVDLPTMEQVYYAY